MKGNLLRRWRACDGKPPVVVTRMVELFGPDNSRLDTQFFAAGCACAFRLFVEQRGQKTWGGGGRSALRSLGCGLLQLLHARAQLTNLLFQLNDLASAALAPSNLSRTAACRQSMQASGMKATRRDAGLHATELLAGSSSSFMRRIASATTCWLSSSQNCDWMPMAVPAATKCDVAPHTRITCPHARAHH